MVMKRTGAPSLCASPLCRRRMPERHSLLARGLTRQASAVLRSRPTSRRSRGPGMVPLTRRSIVAGSPHPRQEPEAEARACKKVTVRLFSRGCGVKSGCKPDRGGRPTMWRRYLVFIVVPLPTRGPQTLPTAVGVSVGVVGIGQLTSRVLSDIFASVRAPYRNTNTKDVKGLDFWIILYSAFV